MPDGQETLTKQPEQPMSVALAHRAIVERLKSKRSDIAKLPVEKQMDVYGASFDRFFKPTLAHSKLSNEDMEIAKDQWITALVGGKSEALPKGFGVDPVIPDGPMKVSAGLAAGEAAFGGVVKNVVDWLGFKNSKVRKILAEGEQKEYELAHSVDPKSAEKGAAIGRQVPMAMAFGGGSAAVDTIVGGTGKGAAAKLLTQLARTGGGLAAQTPLESQDEKHTVGKFARDTAAYTLVDLVLGKAGIYGSKGIKKIVTKFASSPDPVHKAAGGILDSVFDSTMKEKFPGRTLDDLSPSEFDQVTKLADAKKEASKALQNEADKAVADAKKAAEKAAAPKPLTKDEKIIAKAKEVQAKQDARKIAAADSKAFAKRVNEYKKTHGKVPDIGSPEYHALRQGTATPAEQESKVVSEVTQGVDTEKKVANIKEAQPQVIAALDAVEAITGKKADLGSLLGTNHEAIEQKIAASAAQPESPFKVDMSSMLSAEGPEEYAAAKTRLMTEISDKLVQESKGKDGKAGMALAREANKERERIRSMPVPKTFSKKTLDAKRKSTAHKQGQEEFVSKKVEEQMADPSTDLIAGIDKQKELFAELEKLSPNAVRIIKKAVKGDDLATANLKLERVIKGLKIQKEKGLE